MFRAASPKNTTASRTSDAAARTDRIVSAKGNFFHPRATASQSTSLRCADGREEVLMRKPPGVSHTCMK